MFGCGVEGLLLEAILGVGGVGVRLQLPRGLISVAVELPYGFQDLRCLSGVSVGVNQNTECGSVLGKAVVRASENVRVRGDSWHVA